MIEDARQLPENTTLETDVAIIGGGAAGITIARELAATGRWVCLIESGGLEFDEDTQALYQGTNAGRWYFPLDGCRLRYFGGSTNHWGGWCRPLAPIDFEARDWVPYSGWPISRADLDPWYERAQPVIEAGAFRYESTGFWEEQFGQKMLPFPGDGITTTFFQYSPPTRFGTRYHDDISRARSVRTLLHANVTEIETNAAASVVTGLKLACLGGPRFRVKCRLCILATGGIENARLLLLSNRVQPQGLGNAHDLVGRFFMEHPHIPIAANLVTAQPAAFAALYTRHLPFEGHTVHAALVPTDRLLRQQRLLNAVFTIGVLGVYEAGDLGTRPAEDELQTWDILNLQRDLAAPRANHGQPQAGHQGWPPAGSPGARLALGGACEQAPDPGSRVRLTRERDALGLNRASLDWRLSEYDKQSLNRIVEVLATEFGAMDLGRLRPALGADGNWEDQVLGGNHHMGTTRMADDPGQGVVDRNCKVHGITNLYIAGSSVFPTSGSANPTLTLVALALRLADHIRTQPA